MISTVIYLIIGIAAKAGAIWTLYIIYNDPNSFSEIGSIYYKYFIGLLGALYRSFLGDIFILSGYMSFYQSREKKFFIPNLFGYILFITPAIMVSVVICSQFFSFVGIPKWLDILLRFLLILMLSLILPRYIRLVRRIALSKHLKRLSGKPPKTLLLRSFKDDETVFLNPTFFQMIVLKIISLEEIAVHTFSRFGNVISIGKPDEIISPLGANRLYVESDWISEVSNLMKQVDWIVFIVNNTDGLIQEIRLLSKVHNMQHVIILFAPIPYEEQSKRWAHFRKHAQMVAGYSLPKSITQNDLVGYFNAQGECKLILGKRRAEKSTYRDYRLALKQAFDAIRSINSS